MSLIKQYLAKANKSQRLAVESWVRIQHKILNLHYIPFAVQSLFIIYYIDYDEFADTGSNITISNDKKMAKQNALPPTLLNIHCFGSLIIQSLNNNNVYRWDLKITKLNPESYYNIMVGVSSKFKFRICMQLPTPQISMSHVIEYTFADGAYIYDESVWKWKNYGHRAMENDIISIELDMGRSQVRFYINYKDQGIAYKDIKKGKDIKYRLAVGALSIGTEIRIINFRTRYREIDHKKCGALVDEEIEKVI